MRELCAVRSRDRQTVIAAQSFVERTGFGTPLSL